MEAPQNKRLYGKICFPLWPTYMGEKGRTLGKTYGIKAMCYWEPNGNLKGTCWEQRKKKKIPSPQKKLKKKKNQGILNAC
jgi:hypothetical protein